MQTNINSVSTLKVQEVLDSYALNTSRDNTALVILSGGQDSSTCLALANKFYGKVYTITFHYGQKNNNEIKQAQDIASAFGVSSKLIDLGSLFSQVCTSALLNNGQDVNEGHLYGKGLPASFVPNRNSMFFTIAHAYAQQLGADHIISGICESDEAGYPDTTPTFQRLIEASLNEGSRSDIHFKAPLLHLNKAETFLLADKLNELNTIVKFSHTCYNNDREHFHEWGYGCGHCNGCILRQQGFEEYLTLSKEK